jgi:DNA-binding PadR family transcriptional regulator
MGLLTDLFKEIPISAILKEKIADIEAKYAAADTENAILKDDLRHAQAEIAELKQQIKELTYIDQDPPESEVELLLRVAGAEIRHATAASMTLMSDGSKARLEYRLHKLHEAGYLQSPYIDDQGAHYTPSPKGLELLVKKNRI